MLIEKDGLVWLSVKVIPNAQTNEIIGWQGDDLKIKIQAVPEKGKANRELQLFIAQKLSVGKSDVRLEQGANSQRKVISIGGVTLTELKTILF